MSQSKQLSSELLPYDVVFDILTRLPVKSLVRFSYNVLYLWNPSIRKFKMLSTPHLTHPSVPVAIGLAYHSQNNDFKILRIVLARGYNAPPAEVEVYSLSTDSWRRFVISLGSIDYIGLQPSLFFNGALHSIAWSRSRKSILSFDVNDERFREIMLPQNYEDDILDLTMFGLAVFKGSLAFFVWGASLESGICYLWVMREYGVVESWTKISVPLDSVKNFFGWTDSGELLVDIKDRGLISYDPVSLNENNLGIQSPRWVSYTADLMENLVLLNQRNLREATNTSSYACPLRAKYPSLPSWEVQVTNDSGEGETMIVPCSRHVPYVPWTGGAVEADFLRSAIPLLAEQGGNSSKYHKES
uniref:F-box associated beta-propeller type 3 domain-containing protein n=1 Tax=Fagus sylvatica TaxID=28930 RepID=A0A2N9FFS0_FAGSY